MEMYEISKRHERSPELLQEEVLRGPVTVVGALQRLAQATYVVNVIQTLGFGAGRGGGVMRSHSWALPSPLAC